MDRITPLLSKFTDRQHHFRVVEAADPDTKKISKVQFELVGICYEYSAMVDSVFAPHVDHVLADGMLRPMT